MTTATAHYVCSKVVLWRGRSRLCGDDYADCEHDKKYSRRFSSGDAADIWLRYKDPNKNAVEFADSLLKYQSKYNVTAQQLARETQITPGTVHHYMSVAKASPPIREATLQGKLTFKEARTLVDLPEKYQEPLAQPFVDGTLASTTVEQYVAIAIRMLKAKIIPTGAGIMDVLRGGSMKKPQSKPEVKRAEPEPVIAPDKLILELLAIAGKVDYIPEMDMPEYHRKHLKSTLMVLKARVERGIEAL